MFTSEPRPTSTNKKQMKISVVRLLRKIFANSETLDLATSKNVAQDATYQAAAKALLEQAQPLFVHRLKPALKKQDLEMMSSLWDKVVSA